MANPIELCLGCGRNVAGTGPTPVYHWHEDKDTLCLDCYARCMRRTIFSALTATDISKVEGSQDARILTQELGHAQWTVDRAQTPGNWTRDGALLHNASWGAAARSQRVPYEPMRIWYMLRWPPGEDWSGAKLTPSIDPSISGCPDAERPVCPECHQPERYWAVYHGYDYDQYGVWLCDNAQCRLRPF
jgi:hypothetical protein